MYFIAIALDGPARQSVGQEIARRAADATILAPEAPGFRLKERVPYAVELQLNPVRVRAWRQAESREVLPCRR